MSHPAPERRSPPRGDAAHDLLARLTRPEDDEYSVAADRRRSGHQPPIPGVAVALGFGVAVAVLVVLVTVSAVQTRAGEPQAEADRLALLERLADEKAEVARLGAAADATAARVAVARARAVRITGSVTALEDRVDALGALVGSAAVSGPGVRVVIDDSADAAAEGKVLDTDLQRLVNGLWEAGAEAVAVNGQRLTTLSAIRTAGQAITVNYRSLSPPYTVSAIGDPDTLPARLLETSAGQTFTDLQTNFGLRFDVEARNDLELPAGSRLQLDVATASRAGTG